MRMLNPDLYGELEKDALSLPHLRSFRLPGGGLRGGLGRDIAVGARRALRSVGSAPSRVARWGRQLGSAVTSPVRTLRRGWEGMAAGQLSQKANALAHSRGTGFSGEGWQKMMEMGAKNPYELSRLQGAFQATQPGQARRLYGMLGPSKGARHLLDKSQSLSQARGAGGAKGVAEELSRRGWTGQGNVTKYLPGGKATVALGGVQAARAAAKKPTESEQAAGVTRGGKVGRHLGYAGSQVLLSATPMGLAGGLLAHQALSSGARRAGTGVSRVYRKARGMPSAQEQARQIAANRQQAGVR